MNPHPIYSCFRCSYPPCPPLSLSGAVGRAGLIMDLFCHKAIKSAGTVSCLKHVADCCARGVRCVAVGIFHCGSELKSRAILNLITFNTRNFKSNVPPHPPEVYFCRDGKLSKIAFKASCDTDSQTCTNDLILEREPLGDRTSYRSYPVVGGKSTMDGKTQLR